MDEGRGLSVKLANHLLPFSPFSKVTGAGLSSLIFHWRMIPTFLHLSRVSSGSQLQEQFLMFAFPEERLN
jgi:hypothetical protein